MEELRLKSKEGKSEEPKDKDLGNRAENYFIKEIGKEAHKGTKLRNGAKRIARWGQREGIDKAHDLDYATDIHRVNVGNIDRRFQRDYHTPMNSLK